MKATDQLMEEHRVIERVLIALEFAVNRLQRGSEIRSGFFTDAVEFIQKYADGVHHMKEEGVLFEVLVSNGMPRDEGPIAVMLAEHVQGRKFTRGIQESADRWAAGDPSALDELINHAMSYVTLLRGHIAKEDNILFPMANQIIPEDQHDNVFEESIRVEREQVEEDVHGKYSSLAEKLEGEMRDWMSSPIA
jgi:hemerythrin-like domain-containing protein